MSDELRILTRDVPNPIHDKRCRYGERGIDVFKAGTVLQFRENRFGEKYVTSPSMPMLRHQLHELLAPLCEPYKPKTFADLATIRGFSASVIADDVLEELIRRGAVSLDVANDALDAILKD